MRNGLETLQFNRLVKEFREVFPMIPDQRKQNKIDYPLTNVGNDVLARPWRSSFSAANS